MDTLFPYTTLFRSGCGKDLSFGADRVHTHVPGLGCDRVDLLGGEGRAHQPGRRCAVAPEREAAIVPACSHAEAMALRIKRDQGGDDERHVLRCEQGVGAISGSGMPYRLDNSASPARHGAKRSRPSCRPGRSAEQTSELQSLMRISYAVFCSQ